MKVKTILVYCFLTLFIQAAHAQPLVEFIENKGQWPTWFKYKATMPGGEIYLEDNCLRYILCDAANAAKMDSFHHGLITEDPMMRFHVYKMSFEGANQQPKITGQKKQKNYYNYFLGNDPKKWKSDIHPYLAMDYNELYKGIDMHLSSDGSSLVYEFFVQPGADAAQVKLNFEGPDKMYLNDGNLIINTSVGQMMEMKPVAYQYINDNRTEVACNYRLKNNRLTFEFPDDYDHTKQLIIDPTVVYCSFTGSTADNWGFTATYDNSGNMYLGGFTNGLNPSESFPVSPGAYQSTFAGGQTSGGGSIGYAADISVIKLSSDEKLRIYATYIGGSNNERPHSMIVDNAGNLIIAGRTHSSNYPVTPTAYQSTNKGGWDIIVTTLNATGTGLVGSTYIGGSGDDGLNFDSTEVTYGHLKYNYGDDARSEVQIDNAGNVYVASSTMSPNFPTTPGVAAPSGFQDGVVFKMNSSLSTLLWSRYISGIGDDAGYVLAFNTTQTSVYVAGGTNSPDLLSSVSGGWQPTYRGDSADGYIMKFQNSPPYTLQKATYLGTAGFDQVYGLQVDPNGNVYAMGQALGGAFPVTAGVYSNPNSCQFIIKMDSNLTTDLISTVYGSKDPTHTNISPVAFLVDTCENVYISGWGGDIMGVPGLSHSGTTTGMPITPADAILSTTDGFDFYFIVLGPGMTSLRYGSFYGRSSGTAGFGEHVDGGTSRFDKSGIIYQAICANCGGSAGPAFPTTAGVWAPVNGCTYNCNEAGLKIAFNIGPVAAKVTAGPATSGCAPLKVDFTNTSNNALTYFWDFGDGTTSTTFSPTHTFVTAGTFTVTLSAANSNACFKTNDTMRLIIVVDTNIIKPDFSYVLKDSCNPYVASFTNISTDHVGTPTFEWHFGDGTNYTGTTPPDHSYPDTGTYKVMLVMSEPLACKSPDTVIKTLSMHNFKVSGSFQSPDTLCLGSTFSPDVTATNATGYTWTMGDTGFNGKAFSYRFPKVGTYTLTLTVSNSGACNGSVSQTRTLTVIDGPLADFTYGPIPSVANVPVTFTNQSVRALTYLWEFGDNTTSNEVNPVHQYNKTGTYNACLNAYNLSTCPSKICKDVSTEVVPILGLPTAFSPNGDGVNDVLYVRGAAIQTLDLKIFNRWGQLIFETNSKDIGWDGTFNGKPQPIEAYAFVLNASFIDGTAKTMKGNITLLR